MASNRLLSQITELHQVIAVLKAENRRLVSRAKASRAYARTVEQSTFFPYAASSSGLAGSGGSALGTGAVSSSSLPVLSLSASVVSNGGAGRHHRNRTPSLSSSSSSSALAIPQTDGGGSGDGALFALTSAEQTAQQTHATISRLERDNLYLSNRVSELEATLSAQPSADATLAAHARSAVAFLDEREKNTCEALSEKLRLLTEDLVGLRNKRSRVALKEKIMIEIETGRVGTRHNPVPALTRKIKHLEVRVGFLQQVKDLVTHLTSQLQHMRSTGAVRERDFRKQLEEKRTTIMDQGLRIRHYEKDAAKRASQQARNEASLSLVLDNMMMGGSGGVGDGGSVGGVPVGSSASPGAGSFFGKRIDTPSGSLVLVPFTPEGTPVSMGAAAAQQQQDTGNNPLPSEIQDPQSLVQLQRSSSAPNINVPGTMDPSPSMLEESLKHVGGLPPMGSALTHPSPHLVPPHQLPRGRAGGDPRDNGRPGSRSSEARRNTYVVSKQGRLGRTAKPLVYQISSGQKDMLTGQILWKNIGIFNRMDAVEMFAGKGRHIYRQ